MKRKQISNPRFFLITTLFLWQTACVDRQQLELARQVEDLNQAMQQLTQQGGYWPSEQLAPVEIEITDLRINHKVAAFREHFNIKARISPSLPAYLSADHLQLILGYEVNVATKQWRTQGTWVGTVPADVASDIEIKVKLPELGFADQEIAVSFEGHGVMPLVPVKVYRN